MTGTELAAVTALAARVANNIGRFSLIAYSRCARA
jgi:hypothetical protein